MHAGADLLGLLVLTRLSHLVLLQSSFDITGQGTILGHGAAAKSAPSTPVASRQEASQRQEQLKERAKTASRLPNKKQQMKHAMTVQSAHMITTDFQMLSRPLEDGILLMDRTERKLKLIKSLGELLPQHQYSTEYGNVLERTMKHKAMLAGSIPLDVATDEVDFDNKMHALALDEGARPTTHTKMAAYEAMSSMASLSLAEQVAATEASIHQRSLAPAAAPSAARAGASHSGSAHGALPGGGAYVTMPSDQAAERLQEEEAQQRIAALVDRMAEMEQWFAGVKAEAERERKMREQARGHAS